MLTKTWTTVRVAMLVAPVFLTAACASQGDMSRAQANSDRALATANQAKATADRALALAEQASADAKAANAKADRMFRSSLRK